MKTRTSLVIGVLILLSLSAIPDGRAAAASSFTILSVNWGTAAKPIEVTPGSTNVPLTVTILYTGAGTIPAGEQAETVQGLLQLAAATINKQETGGFTDIFGNTTASALAVTVNPDATFVLIFYLDVANTAKTGTYSIPLQLDWTTASSGSSGYYVQLASVSVNMLGTPDLAFSASPMTLIPGSVNNVSLTVSNRGSGEASQIEILISASGVSVLDPVSEAASLNAGQSMSQEVQLYVPTSSSTSSVALTVAATYYDAYGSTQSVNQMVVLYVSSLSTPSLSFQLRQDSVIPGQTNAVNVTLSNLGTGAASEIRTQIASSNQFSVLDQFPVVGSLGPNSSVTIGVRIYVSSALSGSPFTLTLTSSYTDEYGNAGTSTQTLGLYVSSESTPSLSFQLRQDSVIPGQNNTVAVTLTNLGTGTASEIRTQIASSNQFSVLDQFPVVGSLGPNSSVTADIGIYVSSALSGSPFTLTLTSSYTDEYGNAGTSTQTLGLYAINTNTTQTNGLVSARILENEVKVGTQSKVAFIVQNVGSYSLTSPTLSLAVSSPLVVTGNSSYSLQGTLRPGESVTYEATVGAGTSATPGFYTATVTLSYVDESGVRESQSFSFGIVLSGNIVLVLQSPEVVQSTDSLVVSGSILNEGFSSAYYASVTGSLAGTKTASQADYVGEVDPNTPVPFSVTIAYTPQNVASLRANVSITVSYQNSLGSAEQYTEGIPTTLSSSGSSQTTTTSSGTSSGAGLLPYVEYGMIIVVVLVAVVGAVYVRRNRPRAPGRDEADEPKVI